MGKLNLKTTATAKRKDAFTMNPKDIIVNWEENPREDYGSDDFIALKESIRACGEVIYPLMITPTNDGDSWSLSHGFRRYKAIMELADEGFVIESVKVMAVFNEEDVLINHIILNNTTKQLNDVELADTLRQLSKMSGDDNMQTLSKRTGIPYQKVRILMGFAETAGTALKQAVKKDEISFSAATEIAQNSNGIENQMEILDAAKKGAESEGKKKVSGTHVNKAVGKEPKRNNDLMKIRNVLIQVGGFEKIVEAINNVALPEHELIAIVNQQMVS